MEIFFTFLAGGAGLEDAAPRPAVLLWVSWLGPVQGLAALLQDIPLQELSHLPPRAPSSLVAFSTKVLDHWSSS